MNYSDLVTHGSNIRVHGNGFVQIDMIDGSRVHCWGHPDIPRQRESSQIHDHSFDFTSTILAGSLVNVIYWAYSAPDADKWDVYRPVTRDRQDTVLERVETCTVVVDTITLYRPGEIYAMWAGELHETFANQPTVTHMTKTRQADMTPRVLLPSGKKPDNEFNRYAFDTQTLWRIVKECMG